MQDNEAKSETIHSHNIRFSRSSWYIIALLIPPIIFVLVVAFYFKYTSYESEISTSSEAKAYEEVKQIDLRKIWIEKLELKVEVANDDISRAQGLSERTSLEELQGVLFVFDSQNIKPPFWMKEMLIPLDIIWINDGAVSQIQSNVQPEPGINTTQLKFYIPDEPIDYVLEVNAGISDKFGVKVGDKVELKEALSER